MGALIPLGLLGGGLAILAAGLTESKPQRPAVAPLIIGGVDLGGLDLTRKFTVDFSVDPNPEYGIAQRAMNALRTFMSAIHARWPAWLVQTELDLSSGTLKVHVTPVMSYQQIPVTNAFSYEPSPLAPGHGTTFYYGGHGQLPNVVHHPAAPNALHAPPKPGEPCPTCGAEPKDQRHYQAELPFDPLLSPHGRR